MRNPRICQFCGRRFRNLQSVRRHLADCEEYAAQARWRCGACQQRTRTGDDYPVGECKTCGADAWDLVT